MESLGATRSSSASTEFQSRAAANDLVNRSISWSPDRSLSKEPTTSSYQIRTKNLDQPSFLLVVIHTVSIMSPTALSHRSSLFDFRFKNRYCFNKRLEREKSPMPPTGSVRDVMALLYVFGRRPPNRHLSPQSAFIRGVSSARPRHARCAQRPSRARRLTLAWWTSGTWWLCPITCEIKVTGLVLSRRRGTC